MPFVQRVLALVSSHINTSSAWRLAVPLLLLFSAFSHADLGGFEERYFSERDGQTWVLQLESSRTFASMITIKLQMGTATRRYILLGSHDNRGISGSYKTLDEIALAGSDQAFSLRKAGKNSVRLLLQNNPDFPPQGVVFSTQAKQPALDNVLIGIWYSKPKLGVSADNPFLGEQWRVHFRQDGVLCEETVVVDKRKASEADPCSAGSRRDWKSQDGKILIRTDSGQWRHAFTYRLMGGRLVASYPDGRRLVASR